MASNFPAAVAMDYAPGRVIHFPVTAGQTFIAGALVYLTSGALTECGADPANIMGIALAPASVGLATAGSIFGGTTIPVFPLTGNDMVLMSCATTPVAVTHVGTRYGIVKSTNWLVDTTDTTNLRVVVCQVQVSPLPEAWWVRFIGAKLQLDGSSLAAT